MRNRTTGQIMTDFYVKLNFGWARIPNMSDVVRLIDYGRLVRLGPPDSSGETVFRY